MAHVLVRGPARHPMSTTHRDWILYIASFVVVVINDHTNPAGLARVLAPRTLIIYKVLSFITIDYHVVKSRRFMCTW